MLRVNTIREINPLLTIIFSQILVFQIQAENELDYSLESPSLLTTSEIAKEIMNQNLNLNCAGLRVFFNSETYQDVEKILNMTSTSTEVNENREEYHSRIKRCTSGIQKVRKENRILREFEKQNRKNELIGINKSNRANYKQKHQKDSKIRKPTTYESSTKADSEHHLNEDDFSEEDLATYLPDSASTETHSRTYRTITENPIHPTTNSALLETFARNDGQMGQSSFRDMDKKGIQILQDNGYNIKDSSTIPSSSLQTNPVQQKSTPQIRSTKPSNKGLFKALLGNIRHVMEGGSLKNAENSSNFDSERRTSSTENISDEESLEYETVTPHKFNDFDRSLKEQKITGMLGLSSTKNPQIIRGMHEEARKQLQSKIEELIKIRKKLVEVARMANSTKNQIPFTSPATFNGTSIKNGDVIKEATGKEIFPKENSRNNLDLERKYKTTEENSEIDARSGFIRHQTTSDPLSSIFTSLLPQNSRRFTITEQIVENTPKEIIKSNFLRAHEPFKNLPTEQRSLLHLTSDFPSTVTHSIKHILPKHERPLNQHVSEPHSSQNLELHGSISSARSQGMSIKIKEKDKGINSPKVKEHFTRTPFSRYDPTTNMIHTHTTPTHKKEDTLILKSPTETHLRGDEVIGISSSTLNSIESFPTEYKKSASKKYKTSGLGISERKESDEMFHQELDTAEHKNYPENEPVSQSKFNNNVKLKSIVKNEKKSTQHSTTPKNSYIEPNESSEISSEAIHPLNHHHLSHISSILPFHPIEKSSKEITITQTSYLRENESEKPFQTPSILKQLQSNKMTIPQQKIMSTKESVLPEDSHLSASVTPHTSGYNLLVHSKGQDTPKPISVSKSPHLKEETVSHQFHHHGILPNEVIFPKNSISTDISTIEFNHHAGKNAATEQNAATMEISHSTTSTTSQTSHHPKKFSKTHVTFLNPTLPPSDSPKLKKFTVVNSSHSHNTPSVEPITPKSIYSNGIFAPQSTSHPDEKAASKEYSHFNKMITSHSPHDKEKDPKSIFVAPKSPEFREVMPYEQEKMLNRNIASFDHHSTKITTSEPVSEYEMTSEGTIPTQIHHSNRNSISESLNRSKVSSELVVKSHQSIFEGSQNASHHTATLNPIILSLLEKFAHLQLTNKQPRKNITLQKQDSSKISTLHQVNSKKDTSLKTISSQKPYTDANNPPLLHHHSNHQNLDNPGPQHLDRISTIPPSQLFEVLSKKVTLPRRSHSENHKIPQPIHHHEESPHFGKIATLQPSPSSITSFEETTSPQILREDSTSTSRTLHLHPHSKNFNEFSKGAILPQKSHEENHLIPELIHHLSTVQPSNQFEIPKAAILPHDSYSKSHSIPRPVHQLHQHSEIPHFAKTTTLDSTHSTQKSHEENRLIPELVHHLSTVQPSNQFEIPKAAILPHDSYSKSHSIPRPVHQLHQHSEIPHFEKTTTLDSTHSTQKSHEENRLIPELVRHLSTVQPSNQFEISKAAILPLESYSKSHSIPRPVHQLHQHSEIPHFEKTTTLQPTHSTQISEKINSNLHAQFNHLEGISSPQPSHSPEVTTKRNIKPETSLLSNLISQIGHQHPHLHNTDKTFPHPSSRSTFQPSHENGDVISHITHHDVSHRLLPKFKSSLLATEITMTHPQYLFSKSTTKSPELHSEEKVPHSTPSFLHLTTPTKIRHPTIDNFTMTILEEMKRLEREKIEEIKKLQKSYRNALNENQIINPSHTTLPYFDEFYKQSMKKTHITDGTSSYSPETHKHKPQSRSGTGLDMKTPLFHDVTKPYPTSLATLATLQSNLEVLEKIPKPLPPLNPNDNWKYASKLDHYYEKQRQSTTPLPPTIRPFTIPTPKPRVTPSSLMTSSTTMAPTTRAPRVRPSIPPRNATKGKNQQPSSSAAPPTQKSPPPVNYNINSTINRNYNITINLPALDSAPGENRRGDEEQLEDNSSPNEPVRGDEPDPFTSLAHPTESSTHSNEDPAGDFDSPSHPSLPRQSAPKHSNSSNLPSSNNTMQLPMNSITSIQIENGEVISPLQTKITPRENSLRPFFNFENRDAILQSSIPSVTKSADSSTTATTPYQEIINNLKNLTLKVHAYPCFENVDYSTTQPPTTPADKINLPCLTQTVDGNCSRQICNNIIIIPNKTEEIMEILRLLSMINDNNNETLSTAPSTILQSPSSSAILQSFRSAQVDLPQPHSNPFSEIKSLLKSIHKSKITPSEAIELRKSISELLKVLKQRRKNEYNRLYLSKINPMVGDGRDSILAITQINEYIELLELMTVYLARDPGKLLDEIKDARLDNFDSIYPQDDPQRRLIEDQFYFVHPKILNEFIDVYKKYSKDEPYFGKPTWQFSQENGPRRASRSRVLGSSLNNLFHFKELIPALTYNRAPMYGPGVQYESY